MTGGPATSPVPDALVVDDLTVRFGRRRAAVDAVSLRIGPGERLGLIGESGSGKTLTALAVMGLLPEGARTTGRITVAGQEVTAASDRTLSRLRGSTMGMVFQEPMTALDPTMRVGRQVAEAVLLHRRVPRARVVVATMLDAVGLPGERIADAYPHQLSGGQRQRVVLAMALINSPELVICDEPTTALDVTVQARVLDLLEEQLTARSAACLFISHDIALVARVCQRVAVMLDGAVVEQGVLRDVLAAPQHPYTRGLIATARLDRAEPGSRLPTVADFHRRSGPGEVGGS